MFKRLTAIYYRYRETVSYLFWGVMTTLVNYIAYFALTRGFSLNHLIANASAWLISVLFAFAVNKFFVFRSYGCSPRTILIEFSEFCGARILSGLLETGMLYVFVDCLSFRDDVIKIIASIFVVILNYVFSKLIIFRSR